MSDSDTDNPEWDESGFERFATHYHDFYPTDSREDLEFRLTRRLILVARWWTTLIDDAIKRETGQSRALADAVRHCLFGPVDHDHGTVAAPGRAMA